AAFRSIDAGALGSFVVGNLRCHATLLRHDLERGLRRIYWPNLSVGRTTNEGNGNPISRVLRPTRLLLRRGLDLYLRHPRRLRPTPSAAHPECSDCHGAHEVAGADGGNSRKSSFHRFSSNTSCSVSVGGAM